MAHNLATINGQSAMAYLDASPWHGLGQRLNFAGAQPADLVGLALDAAQMRYTVGSVPLYLADGTEVQGYKASVRFNADGTTAAVFGTVGDGYVHTQNEQNTAILEVMAQEFGCVPAAAGVLGQGERCWMLMRLADAKLSPLPGDDVNGYFLLHWGHDGNMSVQGLGTGIRVVCQNTLSMATNGRKAWMSVRHTTNVSARLDAAAKLIRGLMQSLQLTGETFASMARKNVSASQLAAFIDAAIPNTDPKAAAVSPVIVARRDTVAKLVFHGRGAALANQNANVSAGEASVWAAYNAVTEYYDHVRTAEAQSPEGLRRAQESALFGGNAEAKVSALELARELVAA